MNRHEFERLWHAIGTPPDAEVMVDINGNCCPILGVHITPHASDDDGVPFITIYIEAMNP